MGKLFFLWKRRNEWEEKSKGDTLKGFLIILSSLLHKSRLIGVKAIVFGVNEAKNEEMLKVEDRHSHRLTYLHVSLSLLSVTPTPLRYT